MADYSITIDLLLDGLGQIKELKKSLDDLARGAKGASRAASATGDVAASADRSTTSVNRLTRARTLGAEAEIKAADAALRQVQAQARLEQAQGQSAQAIRTLQAGLDGFAGSAIQATRAQIQLTNLQTDYANSPLIGAVRGQSGALRDLGDASQNTSGDFDRLGDAQREYADVQNEIIAGNNDLAASFERAAHVIRNLESELRALQAATAEGVQINLDTGSFLTSLSQLLFGLASAVNLTQSLNKIAVAPKASFVTPQPDLSFLGPETSAKIAGTTDSLDAMIAQLRAAAEAARELRGATDDASGAAENLGQTEQKLADNITNVEVRHRSLAKELRAERDALRQLEKTIARRDTEATDEEAATINARRARIDLLVRERQELKAVRKEAAQVNAVIQKLQDSKAGNQNIEINIQPDVDTAPATLALDALDKELTALRDQLLSGAKSSQSFSAEVHGVAQAATRAETAIDNLDKSLEDAAKPTTTTSAGSFLDQIAGANFLATLAGLNQAIVDAGEQAAGSFSAGALRRAFLVQDAGEKLGDALEEGIRDDLEMRSPSRVLVRLGEQAAVSFADGFSIGKSRLAGLKINAQDLADRFDFQDIGLRSLSISANITAGALIAVAGAAVLAAPAIARIATTGIQAASQLEQVNLGIATVIATVGGLNRAGIKLEGVDALNAALPLAQEQLERLRVDALTTALTFKEISQGFLQAIGPGLAAGLNLDQIRKTVVDLSQVIVPLTGDAEQLGQELRAIFSGDISADSQVALTLFGANAREQVAAAKEQGRLAELLNDKLKAAAATGALMGQTFKAAASNLQDAGELLAAQVTKGLFDNLKTTINRLLPQIFSSAGGQIQVAPAFVGLEAGLSEIFDRLGLLARDSLEVIIGAIKGISAFLAENQENLRQVLNALDVAFRAVAEVALGLAGGLAKLAAQFVFLVHDMAPLLVGLATLGGLLLLNGPYAIALAGVLGRLDLAIKAITLSLGFMGAGLQTTATFLLTTPQGWLILAAAVGAAGLAYLAFSDAQDDAIEKAKALRTDDLARQAGAIEALQGQLDAANRLTGAQVDLNAEQDKFRAILSTLPAPQQKVIEGLGTQKEKVEAVTDALKSAVEQQRVLARAQQAILLQGVAAQQEQIEAARKAIAVTDEQAASQRALLSQGVETVQTQIAIGDELVSVTERVADEELRLGQLRVEQQSRLDALNKSQSENIEKLRATAALLEQNADALIKEAEAGRLSGDRLNLFKRALDDARAAGVTFSAKLNDVAASLAGVKSQAQTAQDAINALFATGDTSEIKKQIDQRVGAVIGAAVKSGQGVAQAVGEVNAAIQTNKDGFGDLIKNAQLAAKVRDAVENRINPPAARTRSSAPASVRQAVRVENRLREEQAQIREALQEQELRAAQDAIKAEQVAIDQSYANRLVTIRDYYQQKDALTARSTALEAAAIERQIARLLAEADANRKATLAAAARAPKAERAQILTQGQEKRLDFARQMISLETELQQVEGAAAAARVESDRERLDALAKLVEVGDDLLKKTGEGFGAEIERRIRAIGDAQAIIQTRQQTSTERINQLVDRGLLSEMDAREAILAIEREKRVEIERQIKAQLELVRLLPDSPDKLRQIGEIESQIVQTNNLGVDSIFGEIRRGLTDDLRGAFFEFLNSAEFGLESLKNLALGFVNSFRRAINRVIGDQIEKKVINPLVGGFLDKVFGIKSVDPTQIANTLATNANTAALLGLTAAMTTSAATSLVGGQFPILLPDNLGAIAGKQATAPNGPLAGLFDRVEGFFRKFADGLGGVVGSIGGALRSILASVVKFFGSLLSGVLGGGAGSAGGATAASFARGGFTGWGGVMEPAGFVHGREFVFSAPAVANLGTNFLANLHRAGIEGGHAAGGFVGAALADSGRSSGGGSAPAINLRLVNQLGDGEIAAALDSSAGEQVLLNRMSRSAPKFRAALGI